MNLLKFTWRTAKLLYLIPLGFTYGTIQQAMEGEPAAAAIVGMVGVVLFQFALLKTAQHRRTLDKRNVQDYVRRLIHNRNTAPFTLPTEAKANSAIVNLFNDPVTW